MKTKNSSYNLNQKVSEQYILIEYKTDIATTILASIILVYFIIIITDIVLTCI